MTSPDALVLEKMINIIEVKTDEFITEAKELFQEYASALGFNLDFQGFTREIDNFPEQYSAPDGRLYLACYGNQSIGCVGLRYFEKGICEIKRLYIRPEFRGMKAGRMLAEASIKAARDIGYEYIRLDTLQSMESANSLYKSLGFYDIEPYRHNPIDGAMYMELDLQKQR